MNSLHRYLGPTGAQTGDDDLLLVLLHGSPGVALFVRPAMLMLPGPRWVPLFRLNPS